MNNELNIIGLKHGGILGGLSSILAFLLIMIGRDTYMTFSGLGIPIIAFALLLYFGIKERKENFNNELPYVAALFYAAIALFINGILASITNIVILNFIDPGIQDVLLNEGMAEAEKMYEMLGLGAGKLDEMMAELEAQIKNSFKFISILTNSWAQLLSAVIFGAIAAIFIKKNKPDFAAE